MLINGSAINAEAINGPGSIGAPEFIYASGIAVDIEQNVYTFASGITVDIEQQVVVSASGIAIDIEQDVGFSASGIAIDIEQQVLFRATGSGIAVDIEQIVYASASGIAVDIEQRVKDSTAPATHLEAFGWDSTVTINGALVPKSEIAGDIVITWNENAATLAEVNLVHKTGQQDMSVYHGKTILIDCETSSGIRRLYTGTIDEPVLDLVNKTIKLKCTDRRDERINTDYAGQLKFIGFWSPSIYNTPDDAADELRQRLETTPMAVDIDAYGVIRRTSILAKSVPDHTLTRCDISQVPPQVSLALRARLINRVKLQFEARWTRLRHREKVFRIDAPSFCDYMTVQGLEYLRVDSVYATLDNFPWPVKPGSISFNYLPPGGRYNCGWGQFFWSPIEYSGTVVTVKDSNGNVVTDVNGNPVTTLVNRVTTDYTKAFAMDDSAARWIAAKRWAQDISENNTITLSAPQSINQYGVIERAIRHGHQVDYDASDYERHDGYQSPAGFISAGSGDYYLDKSGSAQDYIKAFQTAFSVAETQIVRSHRANTVAFRTRRFWPDVEIYQTVAIDTNTVTCRGKVTQIIQRLGASNKRATTDVVLSLSRAQGAQPSDSLSLNLLDAPLIGNPGGDIVYKLYQGQGGGGGTFGTGTSYATPPVKNETITTPPIDDMSRNQQITSNSYTYDVPIQNDPLVVNF